MNPDLLRILEHKQALRRSLAAHPLAEKLRLLDALRERAVVLRRAGRLAVRDASTVRELQSPYGQRADTATAGHSTAENPAENDDSDSRRR